MKKIFVILFMHVSCHSFAQTAEEIFAQKKTRIKYLLQQVAALEVYIGYARKGYAVAKDGLDLIGDIKKGDLNLHSIYFNSLKKINPRVAQYAKVADIISCEVTMVKSYKSAFNRMKQSGQFTEKEIRYIYSVFTKMLGDAADITVQLVALITPGEYEMKDNERLQRIEALYTDMLDKLRDVQHFSNENYVLSVLRKKEQQEVERSLNNVK